MEHRVASGAWVQYQHLHLVAVLKTCTAARQSAREFEGHMHSARYACFSECRRIEVADSESWITHGTVESNRQHALPNSTKTQRAWHTSKRLGLNSCLHSPLNPSPWTAQPLSPFLPARIDAADTQHGRGTEEGSRHVAKTASSRRSHPTSCATGAPSSPRASHSRNHPCC